MVFEISLHPCASAFEGLNYISNVKDCSRRKRASVIETHIVFRGSSNKSVSFTNQLKFSPVISDTFAPSGFIMWLN